MIANYGYEDGSGFFYIAIDTDKCAECGDRACIRACPQGVYETQEDDWGDEVVAVREDKARKLRECCDECKRTDAGQAAPPCVAACKSEALQHTW